MKGDPCGESCLVRVRVDPGICGFACTIEAWKSGHRETSVKIKECECNQIRLLDKKLSKIKVRDIFVSGAQNKVFRLSGTVGCHASCPIPVAVVKACEVAMGMALPKNVRITFEFVRKEGGNAES